MEAKQLTLSSDGAAQFREVTENLELRDAEGQTLGFFLPPARYREWRSCRDWVYEWAKAQFGNEHGPEYPDDGRPPMTTEEAIRYIEGVAKSGENAA